MKPRIMPLEELLVELEGEHDEVCYELSRAETELENFNYAGVEEDFRRIVKLLSQHTIDEQRSLLGYLIEKLGREWSVDDIKVMRGQTKIVNLINNLAKAISDGKGISLLDLENLKALLGEQFDAEQSLYKKASSIAESELKKRYDIDIDRYVNEGGK